MLNNFVVYKFTSPSGKSYIGQTNNIKRRTDEHKIKNNCRAFNSAIIKYGFENFNMTILKENLTIEESNHWESFYIKEYASLSPNGYNLCTGGNNSTPSLETRGKMSLSQKGLKKNYSQSTLEEKRKKQSELMRGVPKTEDHKRNISESHKGILNSPETRAKISSANKGNTRWLGKTHTEETKAKLSASRKKSELCIEATSNLNNSKKKSYIVTNPLGESTIVKGMKEFCRENNLHSGYMFSVAKGRAESYKGWKCEYLTQEKAALINIGAA